MLKAQIIGYLGNDAYVNVNEAGSVANFSVAHSERWRDANGVQKERTTWVSCSLFDKENVYPYLKKGQQVYIEGFPGAKQYKDREDKLIPQMTIRVNSIQLIGGAKSSGAGNDQETTAGATSATTGNDVTDDLPF